MIETLTVWLTLHAQIAPLLVFGLLLLTGFSFPISEDVMVIVSGVVARCVLPEKTVPLFIAVFLGAYFSDWIAFWIGRLVGPKLAKFRIFPSLEKRAQIEKFFTRYGFYTLFFGRLIPFGIRNSIFMVAGANKMKFSIFLLSDGISCLLFTSTVFALAWHAGEGYGTLVSSLRSFGYVALFVLLISTIAWFFWNYLIRQKTEDTL